MMPKQVDFTSLTRTADRVLDVFRRERNLRLDSRYIAHSINIHNTGYTSEDEVVEAVDFLHRLGYVHKCPSEQQR